MIKTTSTKDVKRLLHRRQTAYSRKMQWQSLLQHVYKLSQPNRNILGVNPVGGGVGSFQAHGENLSWDVFDLTLAHGTDVYVNRMVNALIPPGKKWLNFIPGSEIPEENYEEAKEICQGLTDIFFRELARSNFDSIAPECFYDMCVSTGFMIINEGRDEDDAALIFASMPPNVTYASEGVHGTFDAYYRDFVDLPVEHAKEMWQDFCMPSEIVEKDIQDTTITLYEITYFCYDDRKWHYCVVYPASHKVCYERIEDCSPCIGFRSKKLSGEVYGRGVSLDAAGAAATINQAMYDEIQAANFQAQPIYMGFDDGVFNPHTFKMAPNTIIACSPSASGAWPLQPLPQAGNIQWTAVVIEDLRKQINDIMLTAPFGSVDSPAQTATEIIQRQQQILENASAAFSRIQREFFEPVVKRVISILKNKGLWDDIEIDGKMLSVSFETPLAQSESQQDVLKLLQHHDALASIVGPEMSVGFYHLDEISGWIADKMNVPLELIKSQEELIAVFEKMQEAQAAQAEQTQEGGGIPEGEEVAAQQGVQQ